MVSLLLETTVKIPLIKTIQYIIGSGPSVNPWGTPGLHGAQSNEVNQPSLAFCQSSDGWFTSLENYFP